MNEQALRHKGLGIASFAIAVTVFVLTILLFGTAGLMRAGGKETATTNVIIGTAMMALWFVTLVALGLGIAGAIDKGSKKIFPILGIVFNVGFLLITIGAVVIALSMM